MPFRTSLPLPGKLRQIDGLQALRFVAVLLVVWLHSTQRVRESYGHALPNLGVFGVDIFFVISGFIVSSAAGRSRAGLHGVLDYLKRRAIRIYPPFWLLGGLFACIVPLRHGSYEGKFELATLLLTPPLHYPMVMMLVGVAWTLYFEVFFYIVLGCVLLFTARRAKLAVSLVLIALVIAGASAFDIRRPVWFVAANPMLLEFVFGAAIAALAERVSFPRWVAVGLIASGMVAAFALNRMQFGAATGMVPVLANEGVFRRVFTWGLAASLIVAGAVFSSWEPRSWLSKTAVILGNASYSTYLISELVLEFANRVPMLLGRQRVVSSGWQATSFALFDVIGVLLVGWLVYQYVEWPLLRFLQKRLLTKSSRA